MMCPDPEADADRSERDLKADVNIAIRDVALDEIVFDGGSVTRRGRHRRAEPWAFERHFPNRRSYLGVAPATEQKRGVSGSLCKSGHEGPPL